MRTMNEGPGEIHKPHSERIKWHGMIGTGQIIKSQNSFSARCESLIKKTCITDIAVRIWQVLPLLSARFRAYHVKPLPPPPNMYRCCSHHRQIGRWCKTIASPTLLLLLLSHRCISRGARNGRAICAVLYAYARAAEFGEGDCRAEKVGAVSFSTRSSRNFAPEAAARAPRDPLSLLVRVLRVFARIRARAAPKAYTLKRPGAASLYFTLSSLFVFIWVLKGSVCILAPLVVGLSSQLLEGFISTRL